MKTIRFKGVPSDHPFRYQSDLDRMISVAAEAGYLLSADDAESIWNAHSETFCAGWLMMSIYDDYKILQVIKHYSDAEVEK